MFSRIKSKLKLTLVILLTFIVGMKAPALVSEFVLGFPKNSSQPVSLHFAMSNYRKDYGSLPGWVDGYHADVYSQVIDANGYVNASTVANNLAKKALGENLISGPSNPKDMFNSYKNKIITGWGSKDFGIFNEFSYTLKNLNNHVKYSVIGLLIIIDVSLYLIVFGSILWFFKAIKFKESD